jgi:ferredoxin-thioredoxin reductase catalytic subunit
MFVNLYKKLTLISEESTSEKDDKAEKAAKKVAKDIEYDEGHKGKDDDKAEEAGKKVKKDIEYDDKKDKKKIDEWANDAGKNGTDTSFETDIDFMMNVISGGLNKRKSTGQTTIPVIAGQNRTTSQKTTDINESVEYSNDAVAQWKKLAGLK